MSLTITIPGAVNVTTGAMAPAVLTIGVGVPGAQGPQGPAGPGVPAGGTAGQFLQKIDGVDYNTDWVTLNLSAYAVKANNLSDLTSASTARTNLGLGTMATASAADYSTTTVANGLYYPLTGNPSAFLTSASLSGYLTSATAASTYAPIAAGLPTGGTVGQVLTKNSGTDYDDSWQTLIPGDRYLTTSTTSNSVSNGSKTFTVGTGLSYSSQQDVVISYDASNHMHARVTSYNSGTGVLVVDVQNHTGSGTYTSWTVNVGGMVPLQTVEWGEILGTLGDQSDLASALNGKLESTTAASTYAALAGATFTGEVVTPASTTSNAGLTITPGVAPTTPTNGELWATTTDLQVRLNGTTETIAEQSWVTAGFYPLSGNPSSFLVAADITGKANLSGATFTGLVGTVASATTGAGLNIPHGTAPTSPVNGDVWTTTGNLWVRINGVSQAIALQGNSAQLSSNNIFTNASSTYGNSTATGTIGLASGATISGSTKTLNIGTGGVSGSTTNITIGPVLGASTTSIGNTTAASTLNLATGAAASGNTKAINIGTGSVSGSTTTVVIGSNFGTSTTLTGMVTATGTDITLGNSASTSNINLGTGATFGGSVKAVNIGTNGVALSTTNITIGSITGTSTTTLQGTTNGVTAAADTNSTALATTAYVVGQAGSATPLVNGTATVGTSLRYARQDHVHPTDTTRAPLASPTFTGTPTLPTGTIAVTQSAGNNTTAVATTAFVQQEVPAASTTAAGKIEIATNAEVFTGTSSTLAVVPNHAGFFKADPRLRQLGSCNNTQVAGSGAVTAGSGQLFSREMYLGSLAAGRATFTFGYPGGEAGMLTSKANKNVINFSKQIWVSGSCSPGITAGGTNYFGDANTVARVSFGGYGTAATGDMSTKGIGWKKVGGTSSFVTLSVHNGTTLTNVASSIAPAANEVIDWMIYSDGTGNVTLYINGAQAATTSAGPTGTGTANNNAYYEQVEGTGTPTVRHAMHAHSGWIYLAD